MSACDASPSISFQQKGLQNCHQLHIGITMALIALTHNNLCFMLSAAVVALLSSAVLAVVEDLDQT